LLLISHKLLMKINLSKFIRLEKFNPFKEQQNKISQK